MYTVERVTNDPTYGKSVASDIIIRLANGVIIRTVGYLNELLEETIKRFQDGCTTEVPELLCSGYDRPKKDVAVKAHRSRFGAL